MGVINRLYTFMAGSVIRSAEINAEFDQILDSHNGNIDQNNLADDAVTTAKIADSAVTAAKIAAGYKLVDSSVTADNLVHAATPHTRVFGADLAKVGNLANPANRLDESVAASAANSANYNFYIPVHGLPIGAVITRVDLYGYTGSSTNNEVSIILQRYSSGSSTANIMATLTITNSLLTDSETTISDATISENYRYQFLCTIKATGSTAGSRFYQAKITFTTNNLGQI